MTKDFNKYLTSYGFDFGEATDEEFLEAFEKVELFPSSKVLSDYTESAYKEDLNDFLSFLRQGNITLKSVNVIDVQDYQAYLMKRFAARSVRRKLGILKRLLNFGYTTKFYKHYMSTYINNPKIPKFHESSRPNQKGEEVRELSLETANILIDALDKIVITKREEGRILKVRNRLIGYFLLTTGMRANEIINLKWHDILYEKDVYSVEFKGKGGKWRKIPLGEELLNEMFRYRELLGYTESFSGDDRPIFIAFSRNKFEQLSYDSLYKMIKKVASYVEANTHISPHWFRHTFITTLLEQGTPLAITKQLAGHSNISTTNLYLEKINQRSLEKEFNKVDFGTKKKN